MTTVVRFFARSSESKAAWTAASEAASRADVASSNTKMGGSLTIARAIAMRCFCPPESCTPFSPTWVLYLSGKACTKLSA
mmetsp:Transcript_45315/g.87177  ORF Transcript_45315/g.87177 Transcript_45315/m.87177 type:complete len:80 (-) Transcript_45315:634-873(-)